jgi:hypothetical protein
MDATGDRDENAASDEDQPVKLHARVAPADQRQKEVEARCEVDEKEREQQTTGPPRSRG